MILSSRIRRWTSCSLVYLGVRHLFGFREWSPESKARYLNAHITKNLLAAGDQLAAYLGAAGTTAGAPPVLLVDDVVAVEDGAASCAR